MTNLLKVKQSINCAAALVKTMQRLGVEKIFGYPGASVLSVYNELSKVNEIKHYLVRHEQAAVHMAEGYARVSGKVGVVLVTSGPGFTNTITGIANAYADSTPLVILAGDVSANNKESKVFQNVDIVSMTKTCTKKTFLVSENDNIEHITEQAFEIANTGVKGPVVIALPRNILEKEFIEENTQAITVALHTEDYCVEIEKLYELLKLSQKPLVLLGAGSKSASDKVKQFVEQHNIPVVSTLMGIGIYPSKSELCAGMIGINGTASANTILAQCDLLISLGVSFSDRSSCKGAKFAPNAQIININLIQTIENPTMYVKADVKEFFSKLVEIAQPYKVSDKWLEQVQTIKSEFTSKSSATIGIQSSFVLESLSEFTQDLNPIVVTDVGQHQMLTAQFFNFRKPYQFITSGGMGTMGFGLPAAIGAYLANTNSLVINITGDGSFQMNLQELATCREHQIPLKIIIMNNGYLGMVRQMQEKIYQNRFQVEMINPDFAKIAEAYDLHAIQVKEKSELIPAFKEMIEYKGTVILDISIAAFEDI